MDKFSWLIGGEAGAGIRATGQILGKTFSRMGFSVVGYDEYPSLIRGGYTNHQLVVGGRAFCQEKELDFLVVLNEEVWERESHRVKNKGIILIEQELKDLEDSPGNFRILRAPLKKMAIAATGDNLAENITALGVTLGYLGLSLEILERVVHDQFARKSEKVVAGNQKAARLGCEWVKSQNISFAANVVPLEKEKRIYLTGNEAMALGAVSAGVNFYAAYPMTPVTAVLHEMTDHADKFGIIVKQTEDEIAALNMCLGASVQGARVLTATSGGGFCLMTETLGLSAMTEIPVTIILGMRPGPATGMPTWTEQGDLRFAIHAHHGEFTRLVLSPGDVVEAFEAVNTAVRLAEKYRLPAIILTDKFLSETEWTAGSRYFKEFIGTGRTVKYLGRVNSDEHNEFGFSTDETGVKERMTEKRVGKLKGLLKDIEMNSYSIIKNENYETEITLLGWGSTKRSMLAASEELNKQNVRTQILHYKAVWPLFDQPIINAINKTRVVLVENNATAQFGGLVREMTGVEIKDKVLKYDGRPIYKEEIIDRVLEFTG